MREAPSITLIRALVDAGAEVVAYLKLRSAKLTGQFGREAVTSRTVICESPPPSSRGRGSSNFVREQFGGNAASDAPFCTVMLLATAVSMLTPCAKAPVGA